MNDIDQSIASAAQDLSTLAERMSREADSIYSLIHEDPSLARRFTNICTIRTKVRELHRELCNL